MDWKGARDRIQARLAERIREILLDRGQLSAKQILSTLSEDISQPKAQRHWVNSVLYKRRDWFRQVPGPFWRPPQWEAMPSESLVAQLDTVSEPLPIGMIEPIRDETTVPEVKAVPTAEELALRRERERRRAAAAASPSPMTTPSNRGVHVSSPTFGLSDDFHDWVQREKPRKLIRTPDEGLHN